MKAKSNLDKLRVDVLNVERKLADLELSLIRLSDKVKGFDVKKVDEISKRVEELEDIINVLSLGIREMKETVGKETIEKVRGEVEEKLKILEEKLNEVKERAIDAFTKEIVKIKTQLGELSKGITDLSYSLQSLRKEVELTDISTFMEQLDRINERIAKAEIKVNEIATKSNVAIVTKDLELIKERLKKLNKTVFDNSVSLKELETATNVLDNKIRQMNFVKTMAKVKEDIKENEKQVFAVETKLEELNKRLNSFLEKVNERFSNLENALKKAKHLGMIEALSKDMRESVERVSELRDEVESIAEKAEKLFYQASKKVKGIDELREEVEKLKKQVALSKEVKPVDVEDRIKRIEAWMKSVESTIEDLYKRGVSTDLRKELEGLKERLSTIEARLSVDVTPEILRRITKLEDELKRIERELGPPQPIILE